MVLVWCHCSQPMIPSSQFSPDLRNRAAVHHVLILMEFGDNLGAPSTSKVFIIYHSSIHLSQLLQLIATLGIFNP